METFKQGIYWVSLIISFGCIIKLHKTLFKKHYFYDDSIDFMNDLLNDFNDCVEIFEEL